MSSVKNCNISYLNTFVRSKGHVYDNLSKEYFLPNKKSHACKKSYLLKYTEEPIKILNIKRINVHPLPTFFTNYDCAELLEKLEKFLAEKNMAPPGMTVGNLPDKTWLLTVINTLDSEDSMKVFGHTIEGQIITRDINNKYINKKKLTL